MKNLIIVILIGLAGWFVFVKFVKREKPDNAATQYANNLKTSINKAEAASIIAKKAGLKGAISRFRAKEGRFPDSLDELVEKRYLSRLPSGDFDYDSETGQVK